MNEPSDTPRTDLFSQGRNPHYNEWVVFARGLERELSAKSAECGNWKQCLEIATTALRWMVRSSGDEGATEALAQIKALNPSQP